ncbi:MAG: biotin--[acetyl-CoA-carboxylase] ligase [Sphingobacteriaceae bacterium]|jgi:BirA family biotin operon repressor/biotin-[acetyl-CoA-carboxylase] ligase
METLFVGQNAIYLPEVSSTNSYAIELLKNVNLIDGSVIYTTHQTQGRGQRGNTWISQPGLNLATSLVIKPSFLSIKKVFYLYIISALSVHDLMAELLNSSQFDIKIKWPNDILVNSKKIAGILNENVIGNGLIQHAVIGIGININQIDFEDLQAATSLKLLSEKTFEPKTILEKLCLCFEKRYLALKNGHYNELLNTYYTNFYKLNLEHEFELNGQKQVYVVKGINENGLLHLQNSDHIDRYFDIKEIKW